MEQGPINAPSTKATPTSAALSPDDYAAFLRISRATLWRWILAGVLPQPCIRKGRIVRWTRTAVERSLTDLTH